MNITNKKCNCGEALYKFFSHGRKKGCRFELICWNCGLIYKENKKMYKVTKDGVEAKVGDHNLDIGA